MSDVGVVTPRPAASVIVLRRADPFEVLVVRRRGGGTFGDLVVFPGGTVDDDDRFHAADEDAALRVAVLRELAEETGLLVLSDRTIASDGRVGPSLLADLMEKGDRLSVDSLTLISRWLTPASMPYRFDTWFYLLVVDDPPEVVVDGVEVTGHSWTTPGAALDRARAGDWQMILPTLSHLRWLERRHSIEDALGSASGADGRTLISPVVMTDGSLVPVHLPAEGAAGP